VIAAGDYNFDWSVSNGEEDHDEGYDLMTKDGIFTWIRPENLVKIHCSDYNSVLDFVFYACHTVVCHFSSSSSEILFTNPDYCVLEDDTTSDHRPVLARFTIEPGEDDHQEKIMARILAIENELAALKALLQE
jgi:hypothetical protein